MKLQVTFETGHPARLDGLDGMVSPVYSDERPLCGVAVHADWRLNGFLSRLVMEERFVGAGGEWLLVHTQGRLPYTHLFLVGMGSKDERTNEAVQTVLKDVANKVALAGLHAFGIDLYEVAGEAMNADEAMVFFLENLSQAYPRDGLSNPPYRPAIEVQQRNEERLTLARARRARLAEERARWEAEHAQEAALAAASPDPASAAPVSGEDSLEAGEDSLSQGAGIDGVEGLERPRAGQVPPPGDDQQVDSADEPPPHPSTVEEPELEEEPERTVRVVLLGSQDRLTTMRQALRDWHSGDEAGLDVEWSR